MQRPLAASHSDRSSVDGARARNCATYSQLRHFNWRTCDEVAQTLG
jgi:hypothetical protein